MSDPEAPTGTPLAEPPLLADISQDPYLQGVKLIAEAWDCDGLVQVGAFPHFGGRWAEWNGQFRDAVRQFVKGTDGPWAGKFASALCGSPELFGRAEADTDDWWGTHAGARWRGGRGPGASINFVTAHDGFTLADLVAYNEKHNGENGEGGRDGEYHNLSWNCGAEGPTADRGALLLRERQQRNLACALLLAQGVPMVAMGDEYGHSKGGNNNTYCHDSPLNWFQWDALEARDGDFTRFFRHLVHFRRSRAQFRNSKAFLDDAQVQWHGEAPGEPDWSDASRLVAFTLAAQGDSPELFVSFNAAHEAALLVLPSAGEGREWSPLADTSRPAPLDFLVPDEYLSAADAAAARAAVAAQTRLGSCAVAPRSCIILEAVEVGMVVPPGVLRGGVSEPAQPYIPGDAKGEARNTATLRVPELGRSGAGSTRNDASADDELQRMMEENQRLRAELDKRRP